jgi:hypothetical protein
MKKKLVIGAIAIILLTPVLLTAEWIYGQHQVATKAEEYFRKIPVYPGSLPKEKSLSSNFIGYGYRYTIWDNPDKVLSFYVENLSSDWIFEENSSTYNSRSKIYRHFGDDFRLLIDIGKIDNSDLSKPPYDLTIRVYQFTK